MSKVAILTVTDFNTKEINTYNLDHDQFPLDLMIDQIHGCKVCDAPYDDVLRRRNK